MTMLNQMNILKLHSGSTLADATDKNYSTREETTPLRNRNIYIYHYKFVSQLPYLTQ